MVPTDTEQSNDKSDTRLAWSERAGELALWAWARLVNRIDVRGGYRLDAQTTVKGRLTRFLLERHFRAKDYSDILGLHTASADNQSKGGGLDIDNHGPTSTAADVNFRAALHWYGELARLGFQPLLLDSNGRGGFHERLLLSEAIPADRLFRFLAHLTRDYRQLGFAKAPEQFPKQADVRRCKKGLGNWLRLPGKHHKREHWSRVWDGKRWLEGHQAIDFMLALKGDSPGLVPNIPPPPAAIRHYRPLVYNQSGNLSRLIAAYMRRLPHGGEGSGRDDVAYCFAAFLVRDLALDDVTALDWLCLWDQGNTPPKGRQRLAKILANAHDYGQRPIGCGRKDDAAPQPGPRIVPAKRPGHYLLRCQVEIY
jgi:hypothetical protein